jgi:ATP-dependent exoDNAse (exonuclease V) alpha subunit
MASTRVRAVRSDLVTDVERPWVELVEEVGMLPVRDALLEAGVPASQAAGIAFWLADQSARRRHINGDTAWRYRQLLSALGPPTSLRAIPGYLASNEVAA